MRRKNYLLVAISAAMILALAGVGSSALANKIPLNSPRLIALVAAGTIVLAITGTWIQVRMTSDASRRENRPQRGAYAAEQGQRADMLNRVEFYWIKGNGNKQSTEYPTLDLRLADKPNVVSRPIDKFVQTARESQLLPTGKKIESIFDENDKRILILGAPGSGKTTLLLQLTQALLKRARQDANDRIPVVFNLSSWAANRVSLLNWLAAELNTFYGVPEVRARVWVEEDRILPLLDGLDEVAPEHREACARAINAFHQEHGFTPIVVCCRSDEYLALHVQLELACAVEVQLPGREPLETYIRNSDDACSGLRKVLDRNPGLWQVIDSPLMLNVATSAYRNAGAESDDAPLPNRDSLFERYVDEMLSRGERIRPYPRRRVEQWLAWLGYSMAQFGQTVFQLENLEQAWLRNRAMERALNAALRAFIGLAVFSFALGLFMWLSGGDSEAIRLAIFYAVAIAGISVFSYKLTNLRPVDRIRLNLRETPRSVWTSLQAFKWLFGFYGAIGLVLLLWRRDFSNALQLLLGFIVVWLLLGLAIGVPMGLWRSLVPAELSTRPSANNGTRRSALSALATLVFIAFSGAGACGLMALALTAVRISNGTHEHLLTGFLLGLKAGLALSLVIGALAAFQKGGIFFFRHFAVRAILAKQGLLPWQTVRFLDFATATSFLQKVGGGYIFKHDLLRDYFAKRYSPSQGASAS